MIWQTSLLTLFEDVRESEKSNIFSGLKVLIKAHQCYILLHLLLTESFQALPCDQGSQRWQKRLDIVGGDAGSAAIINGDDDVYVFAAFY